MRSEWIHNVKTKGSYNMNVIPSPWTPMESRQTGNTVEARVWGRSYRQEGACLPTSIQTQNRELLYAPMRLLGEANGEAIQWEDEGCYLLNPTDTSACINGYAQSQCLIVNSCLQLEYDGGARWDIRVMPRGMTVPQVFGLEPCPIKGWNLTKLQLKIPLRKDIVSLYSSWRDSWVGDNGILSLKTGKKLMENGSIPEGGFAMPFMPALWLGDEKAGIQFVVESDEFWQSADPNRAMELKDCGDHWELCCNLLDSLPRSWENPDVSCPAISYTFGLIATPVKPIPQNFLKRNAIHIDCFTKIAGDYWPFLNGPVRPEDPETVIDRLCRAGVNLLILHEKWNKIQNNWNVAVSTEEEITKLVRLCHSRGIQVIPYFGYEITSSMPEFTQVRDDVIWRKEGGRENASGWYRVPYQRAARVCYNSSWADKLVEGILNCIDHFHFDGVYLDGTSTPCGCVNARHGCGYADASGHVHPTFPMFAYRELMKRICTGVHARGGIVNPHPGGATIPFISSFCDMLWDGEHLQTRIRDEGLQTFSLDYFRAEYLGGNFGIPVQFIVYEFPGVWDFDMALSLCMIHGVYPRPNSVLHPLDVMEKIWSITGTFGISEADFLGYWENQPAVRTSNDACKVSFYSRKQVDGSMRLLLIASNPTTEPCENCSIAVQSEFFGLGRVVSAYDAMEKRRVSTDNGEIRLSLKPYAYAIYEVVIDR